MLGWCYIVEGHKQKRKLYDEHKCKGLKTSANGIKQYIQKIMFHDQVGFSPGMREWATYANYTSIDLRTEIYVITDDTHILTQSHTWSLR